jgi:hypothetical protein
MLVRLRENSADARQITIALMQAEPAWQNFTVVKISTAVGGGRWVAICPVTGKRVAYLYWTAGETAIQSRHALGLRYRSRPDRHRDVPLASNPERPMPDREMPEPDPGQPEHPEYPAAAAAPKRVRSHHSTPRSVTTKAKRTNRHAPKNPGDDAALPTPSSQRQERADQEAASVESAEPAVLASAADASAGTCTAISAADAAPDQPTQSATEVNPITATEEEFAKDFERGDRLLARGKFLEAAAIYHQILARCKAKPAEDEIRSALEGIVDRAVHSVGSLAFRLVLAGDCVRALDQLDRAIVERPQWVWLEAIRAHALMFCANVTAARTIYQRHRGVRLDEETTWEDVVRAGFAELRKVGRKHSLMDRVETEFEYSHAPITSSA